jgi:hypothetical protein
LARKRFRDGSWLTESRRVDAWLEIAAPKEGSPIWVVNLNFLCHLSIGRDLADLRKRTAAFAKACPDIACHPVFWQRYGQWDFFGVEFFAGDSLEDATVHKGWLKPGEAIACAEKVMASLERTRRSSSIDAAARELEQDFDEVLACSIFGALDRRFLVDVIFPYIRTGALTGPQSTRWSNGDFIPRNLLVDQHKHVRLIDYEFAERTHFFAEDLWRWRAFSHLPEDVRDSPAFKDTRPTGSWLEAYFILRQMAAEQKINGSQIAVSDARQGINRLMAIMADAHAGFRSSVFLRPAAPAAVATGLSPTASASLAHAQLFWSADDNFGEDRTLHADFAINQEATLTFTLRAQKGELHLRLDPSLAPGLLEISALRVRRLEDDSTLLSLSQPDDWRQIRLGPGMMRLAESSRLNLLSLDNDPYVFLPTFDSGNTPGDIVCEVWLNFTPELRSLPKLLETQLTSPAIEASLAEARQQISAGDSARLQSQAALEAMSAQHEQTQEQLRQASASAEIQRESARRTESELEAARQKVADLAQQCDRTKEQLTIETAASRALRELVKQGDDRSAALQTELESTRKELSSQAETSARLELLAAETRARLLETEGRAETEASSRAQVESTLSDVRQLLAAAIAARAQAESASTAVGQQREMTQEQLHHAMALNQALRESVNHGYARASALQQELETIRQDLTARAAAVAQLEQAAREATARVSKTEALAGVEAAARMRAESAVAALDQQLGQTQSRLLENQQYLQEISTQLQARTEEASGLQLVIRNLNEAAERDAALRGETERQLAGANERVAALSIESERISAELAAEGARRKSEHSLFAGAMKEQQVFYEQERESLLLRLETCENDLRAARQGLAETQATLDLSTEQGRHLQRALDDCGARLATLENSWTIRFLNAFKRKSDESKSP